MASIFDELDASLSEAIGEVMAEVAVLLPRVTRSYEARSVDVDRASFSFRGVFSDGPEAKASGGQYFSAPLVQDMIADFWIAARDVAQLPFEPEKGDQISMVSRPGQPAFMISGLHRTSQGELLLILVEHGED